MKYCVVILMLGTVLIRPGYAQDTVQVRTGWNIIGSVKAGAVPDVLSTIPDSLIVSSFFGYNPGAGYESTDTLDQGIGYWVKVKSDGIIIFDTTPPIDSCKSKAFIYQGKFYHTVKIGGQCWMAENLDVGTMVAGVTNQADNDTVEKYCYNDSLINCTLYGGFYQWDEAMQYVTTPGAQGICPAGWHIPTRAEYQTFSSAVRGNGNVLKAVGQGTGGGTGTNMSGYSVLLAGVRHSDGRFGDFGFAAYLWSSTELDWTFASYTYLFPTDSSVYVGNYTVKYPGESVRCLED